MNMYWTTPIRRQKNWSPTLSLRLSWHHPSNDFGLPPCGFVFTSIGAGRFLNLSAATELTLKSNIAPTLWRNRPDTYDGQTKGVLIHWWAWSGTLFLSARVEFPCVFLKIHERRSVAMKFAHGAVSETTIQAGVAVTPLFRLTQRVGVSRIFDAEKLYWRR